MNKSHPHLNTKILGANGENIACIFIQSKGFRVLERNYRRIWGELDIIATKLGTVHFFEVKSIAVFKSFDESGHRPEDNVHGLKVKRIRRMIETYMEEERGKFRSEFQFHVLCVYINPKIRKAQIKWIENIIL